MNLVTYNIGFVTVAYISQQKHNNACVMFPRVSEVIGAKDWSQLKWPAVYLLTPLVLRVSMCGIDYLPQVIRVLTALYHKNM